MNLAEMGANYALRDNPSRESIEVVFGTKPVAEVRRLLLSLRYFWSRRKRYWWRRVWPDETFEGLAKPLIEALDFYGCVQITEEEAETERDVADKSHHLWIRTKGEKLKVLVDPDVERVVRTRKLKLGANYRGKDQRPYVTIADNLGRRTSFSHFIISKIDGVETPRVSYIDGNPMNCRRSNLKFNGRYSKVRHESEKEKMEEPSAPARLPAPPTPPTPSADAVLKDAFATFFGVFDQPPQKKVEELEAKIRILEEKDRKHRDGKKNAHQKSYNEGFTAAGEMAAGEYLRGFEEGFKKGAKEGFASFLKKISDRLPREFLEKARLVAETDDE